MTGAAFILTNTACMESAKFLSESIFNREYSGTEEIDLSKIPMQIYENPQNKVKDLFISASTTQPVWRDPLLIDLDGDGIETTSFRMGYFLTTKTMVLRNLLPGLLKMTAF